MNLKSGRFQITFVILSAACLGACSPGPLTQDAKEYITKDFLDPESAQFREVSLSGRCITGQVNGKNRFGGFVGYRDFYYDPVLKAGAEEPEEFDILAVSVAEFEELTRIRKAYKDAIQTCLMGEKKKAEFDADVAKILAKDKASH